MKKSEIIKLIEKIEKSLDIDFLIKKLESKEEFLKFNQIKPYIFNEVFSQN